MVSESGAGSRGFSTLFSDNPEFQVSGTAGDRSLLTVRTLLFALAAWHSDRAAVFSTPFSLPTSEP
ncbi:MAG: hypothetical protein MUE44_11875 [Oscillatoriaceae cyanobacterium Prado104]|nr:hypothetical protein [Oscillatoriaceae cyanobacterium Prado104]